MGGPPTPGTGWAAGVERLMLLVEDGVRPARPIALLPLGAEQAGAALRLAERLRAAGHRVEFSFGGGLGKQMKWANRIEARIAVIVGSDEIDPQRRRRPRHGFGRAGRGELERDRDRGPPRPAGVTNRVAEAAAGPLSVFVAGANQRTASLSLRDRLFVEDARVPAVLARLRDAGIGEALLLVTCDRVEVLGIADDPVAAGESRPRRPRRRSGAKRRPISPGRSTDSPARRRFATSSGSPPRSSRPSSENRTSSRRSRRASRCRGQRRRCGAGLEALTQAALAAAKRVRSETGIGRRPVSAAAAAIERAKSVHGDLAAVSALIVGAGEMGELIGTALRGAGLAHLSVTHPRAGRADAAARALSAHVVPFADLADALVDADIVIGSLGGRQHAMTFEAMRTA